MWTISVIPPIDFKFIAQETYHGIKTELPKHLDNRKKIYLYQLLL